MNEEVKKLTNKKKSISKLRNEWVKAEIKNSEINKQIDIEIKKERNKWINE